MSSGTPAGHIAAFFFLIRWVFQDSLNCCNSVFTLYHSTSSVVNHSAQTEGAERQHAITV